MPSADLTPDWSPPMRSFTCPHCGLGQDRAWPHPHDNYCNGCGKSMDPPPPPPGAVRVRIAVAVCEDGRWAAFGADDCDGDCDGDDGLAAAEARHYRPRGVVSFIEADVAVPVPATIEGRVVE